MHKYTRKGKIAIAVIVTVIWLTSLGMIVFEKESFPFTPLIMLNVGLAISIGIREPKRKEITLKNIFPRLLVFLLALGGIVALIVYVPFLREQPPQPYRSIMAAVVLLPFIIWYLWRPIYKEIEKDNKIKPNKRFHSRPG